MIQILLELQFVLSSSILRKCQKMSENVRKCQKMSENVRNVRKCQNVKKCPKMSENFSKIVKAHWMSERFSQKKPENDTSKVQKRQKIFRHYT